MRLFRVGLVSGQVVHVNPSHVVFIAKSEHDPLATIIVLGFDRDGEEIALSTYEPLDDVLMRCAP